MSGRSPPLYCTLTLIAMQGYQKNIKNKLETGNNIINGFGAQIRLHQRYKIANGFRTWRNYYYIWPITLLELKYIITSAMNAAAIAKGMVQLRSILFYSREKRARCGKARGT